MKKKLIAILLCIITLLCIMFAEYRYIMTHQCPYYGDNGTLYIEIFGQVDEYEPASEMYEEGN